MTRIIPIPMPISAPAAPISAPDTPDAPAPRKQSRDSRRLQLIEATIETLARRGYARTTLTDVARCAGISHGLVLFHFATKEGLLAETLRHLAAGYRDNWTAALAAAPATPQGQLAALLAADFNPAVCTPSRLAAWCSFWGEAQSRPLYQAECGAKDDDYNARLESICAALIAADGRPLNPERVARVLRVAIEGVWLDLMTMTSPYSRAEAQATVVTAAAAFFPRHFPTPS